MSGFNGSGTFNISGVGLPYTSGSVISSSVANTLNTQIAAGLSTCILKDGTQTIAANIPWSNYKITGLGAGSASSDAANIYNIQCSTGTFLTVTGADTIVGTVTPALSAGYVTGMTFNFFSAGTNTGAVTLNINGQGAKAITKNGTGALVAGDIPSGILVTVTYDGTQFVLNNQSTFATLSVGTLTVTGNVGFSGKTFMSGGNTLSGNNTFIGSIATKAQYDNGIEFAQNQAAVSTTLNGSISASALSITLTDGTGFPTGGGTIKIDNEQITYASRAGNVLTVSSTANRGVNGSTAAAHNSGAAVSSTTFGSTTLSTGIDNLPATTTIPVADTSDFPNAGTIIIDGEQISYTGKTGTTFTGATRAINGTTIASHASNATVTGVQFISTSSYLIYDNVTKSLTVPNITATNISASTPTSGDNSTRVATTAFVQQTAGAKIQPITAQVTSGSLEVTLGATSLDFRNTGSTGGTVQFVSTTSATTVTAGGSATLGFTSGTQGRLAVLAINNAGTLELALCNASDGGINFDECSLISTSAISGGTSASTVYSTTARNDVAYRVVGYIDATNTSSAWQTTFYAQGAGGNSVVKMPALVSAPSQTATGASIDFTVPTSAKRIMLSFYNVSRTDANDIIVQIGYGTPETTGYSSISTFTSATAPYSFSSTSTIGFVVTFDNSSTQISGHMTLTTLGNNLWAESHSAQRSSSSIVGGGYKSVTTGVTIVRITRASGTGTFDTGTIGLMYE